MNTQTEYKGGRSGARRFNYQRNDTRYNSRIRVTFGKCRPDELPEDGRLGKSAGPMRD